jgi:hypothetical protein
MIMSVRSIDNGSGIRMVDSAGNVSLVQRRLSNNVFHIKISSSKQCFNCDSAEDKEVGKKGHKYW